MNEETAREAAKAGIVGYCRACGAGLEEAHVRRAHGTIYCSEHVPAEGPPRPGPDDSQYTAPPRGEGSPAVAFLLGLIPGVGAIYNGQYAKGMVHIVILATLMMAADNSSGAGPLFGLLIPGFWFYMAFEAYHTARRRREGLPVDEFSGLSDGGRTGLPLAGLLLIFFGVIFLLDNLGWLELRRLVRYWPVGMIALGVYLLVARLKGGGDDPDRR
jgi:hypothetical protein